ncbi:MAG: tripartite tricarboxylate transporter substrate binding protein, partial [Burkholderiaceae bacterium]|nr:tripartite tricarboxylate transporter substrate binding protein [Burkholderiaceae bacterium]
MRFKLKSTLLSVALAAGFAATSTAHAQAKWEPTKAVEFVIPAGPGGGADQMAR